MKRHWERRDGESLLITSRKKFSLTLNNPRSADACLRIRPSFKEAVHSHVQENQLFHKTNHLNRQPTPEERRPWFRINHTIRAGDPTCRRPFGTRSRPLTTTEPGVIYPTSLQSWAQQLELTWPRSRRQNSPPFRSYFQVHTTRTIIELKAMWSNGDEGDPLGPNTDEHDFEFKLRQARNFWKRDPCESIVHFRGRSIVFGRQRNQAPVLSTN